MRQLTITHPEVSLDSLRQALNDSQEKRLAVRILILIKILEGKGVDETTRFFGFHRRSAPRWINKVNKEGLAGLKIKPGRGVKSRLSEKQKDVLRDDLAGSPKSFGFQSNLWTGKILGEHIKRKFSVVYKLPMTYVLLHELGFTLQRPTRQYLGAKPEKQTEFRRELKKNNQSRIARSKQCSSR